LGKIESSRGVVACRIVSLLHDGRMRCRSVVYEKRGLGKALRDLRPAQTGFANAIVTAGDSIGVLR
jgi:hypothetical protein